MNYYERHIGDYLKDTAHLSLLEHGIYGRLLDIYYSREAGIPAEQIARLVGARSDDEKAALGCVLAEFFVLEDGGLYVQVRCDKEIARYQEKQRKAKASADLRWANTERNATAMPTHTEGNAPSLQTQTPVTKKEKRAPSAPRARRCPADWLVPQNVYEEIQCDCPGVDLVAESKNFRDWEFKDPKTDWPAAWRRWMRKAYADLQAKPTGETAYQRNARVLAAEIHPAIARAAPGIKPNPMELLDGITARIAR